MNILLLEIREPSEFTYRYLCMINKNKIDNKYECIASSDIGLGELLSYATTATVGLSYTKKQITDDYDILYEFNITSEKNISLIERHLRQNHPEEFL